MSTTSPSYLAFGTIRPCRVVKAYTSADYGVLEADANEFGIGISMEGTEEAPIPSASTNAATGTTTAPLPLNIHGPNELCKLELGGTVAAGDLIKSDADGKGVVALLTGTTIQNIVARALQAGDSGDKIDVVVQSWKLLPAVA